jgi:hypothetical protein
VDIEDAGLCGKLIAGAALYLPAVRAALRGPHRRLLALSEPAQQRVQRQMAHDDFPQVRRASADAAAAAVR